MRNYFLSLAVFLLIACPILAGETATVPAITAVIDGPSEIQAGTLARFDAGCEGGACAWATVPRVEFPVIQRQSNTRWRVARKATYNNHTRRGIVRRCLGRVARITQRPITRTRSRTRSITTSGIVGDSDRGEQEPNAGPGGCNGCPGGACPVPRW